MDPFQQMVVGNWDRNDIFNILPTLVLFLGFQVKHLVVDFFIQNRFPYMWANKHKLLHPGGWLHAGGHAVISLIILTLIRPRHVGDWGWLIPALVICGMELVIHFLIDMGKMRIGTWKNWKCNTSPLFWDLLGIDQFLHQLTYLWMVYVWVL